MENTSNGNHLFVTQKMTVGIIAVAKFIETSAQTPNPLYAMYMQITSEMTEVTKDTIVSF